MNKEERINSIIKILCDYYGITEEQFNSKSRKAEIVQVRHLASYMIRYELGITFREISEVLNKEVSTVIRNFQNISDVIRHDLILQRDLKDLKEKIRNSNT